MSLAFAPFGKELTVTKILADDNVKRHLENLGIIIGCHITSLVDQNGSVILRVKDTRLALNKSLAQKIYVA